MGPLRRERAVCYSVFSSQGFHHTKPAAVIFILGFVIYRSGRKLKNTAQSHRKNGSAITHSPKMILTCSQTPSFAGIKGALSPTLIPSSNLLPACLGAWTRNLFSTGPATVHISSLPPPGLPVTLLFYQKGHLLEAREPWEHQSLCLTW